MKLRMKLSLAFATGFFIFCTVFVLGNRTEAIHATNVSFRMDDFFAAPVGTAENRVDKENNLLVVESRKDVQTAGAISSMKPLNLKNSFTVEASIYIPRSADGWAFILQNDPRGINAIGGTNADIGYRDNGNGSKITNAVAFELDTSYNTNDADLKTSLPSIDSSGIGGKISKVSHSAFLVSKRSRPQYDTHIDPQRIPVDFFNTYQDFSYHWQPTGTNSGNIEITIGTETYSYTVDDIMATFGDTKAYFTVTCATFMFVSDEMERTADPFQVKFTDAGYDKFNPEANIEYYIKGTDGTYTQKVTEMHNGDELKAVVNIYNKDATATNNLFDNSKFQLGDLKIKNNQIISIKNPMFNQNSVLTPESTIQKDITTSDNLTNLTIGVQGTNSYEFEFQIPWNLDNNDTITYENLYAAEGIPKNYSVKEELIIKNENAYVTDKEHNTLTPESGSNGSDTYLLSSITKVIDPDNLYHDGSIVNADVQTMIENNVEFVDPENETLTYTSKIQQQDEHGNWNDIVSIDTSKAGKYRLVYEGSESAGRKDSVILPITLKIAEANPLVIEDPGSKVYGDADFTLSTSGGSGNGTIKYHVDTNDAFTISSDGAVHIIGSGKATIHAVKESDGTYGESTADLELVIKKRKITIKPNDFHKKLGEMIPENAFELTSGSLAYQDKLEDLGTASYHYESSGTTITLTNLDEITTYDIVLALTQSGKGLFYDITIEQGVLEVSGDKPLYKIEPNANKKGWHKDNVTITPLTPYTSISCDDGVTYHAVCSYQQDADIILRTKKDDGTFSDKAQETIKIDKAAPKIDSIVLADKKNNSLEELLNKLTFDKLYNTKSSIKISASDDHSGVDRIHYVLYQVDKENKNEKKLKEETITTTSDTIEFALERSGFYRICTYSKDHADNEGDNTCAVVAVKDDTIDVDTNDDGCPDLNVDIDNDGTADLNIDKNNDNIPDFNIDTDGDGKPDLNIDSDFDGLADTNLIKLKQWTPKVCTTDAKKYGYMSDLKPEINIKKEKNKDFLYIDVDIDGDMKADINIDTNKDGKPDINLAFLHEWKPEKDYTFENFTYDTIQVKPFINIDSDHDGYPDVNLDIDGDLKPDLNIDVDGDLIPDTNIDSTGDGKANINIDHDKDGIADEHLADISEWNPQHNTTVNGFAYDTMSDIKEKEMGKDYIEDKNSGAIAEADGFKFDDDMSLIVKDITNSVSAENMKRYSKFASDISDKSEVNAVYDVKLLKNNIQIQPDGSIKIKIPYDKELKNLENLGILLEQSDGSFKKITPVIENGYLTFKTDYAGKFLVVSDRQEKSVKGAVIGNVFTGDHTNIWFHLMLSAGSLFMILLLLYKRKKNREQENLTL